MLAPRLALAALLSVLLAGLSSAVTFSPEFGKTLEAGLSKLKKDIQEYPKLQSAVDGIPMDVAGWAALSRDDIVTTLRFFSDQKTNALKNLLITDPANAKKIEAFTKDTHDVIMTFVDQIKSGSFTSAPTATTPAPTTKAPEATKAPETTTTTAPPTAAPAATNAQEVAPAGPVATDASLAGSAGASVVADEGQPTKTTPTPVPSPTKTSSAASLLTTAAPAIVGAVAAACFAMC